MSGVRQCKILTYVCAVLVPLQYVITTVNMDLFNRYDRWAFRYPEVKADRVKWNGQWTGMHSGESGWSNGVGNSFRYAMSMCFDKFIMMPFAAYLFAVLVWVFFKLQQLVEETFEKYFGCLHEPWERMR